MRNKKGQLIITCPVCGDTLTHHGEKDIEGLYIYIHPGQTCSYVKEKPEK